MAAGLHGQNGDNVPALAGRDYKPESAPAQNHRPAMAGRNARDLPNSTKIVYLSSVQMVAGRRGQVGENVLDIAGQDFRPASDPAQTHHLVMAGGNALDLPNNIKTVCFIDAL